MPKMLIIACTQAIKEKSILIEIQIILKLKLRILKALSSCDSDDFDFKTMGFWLAIDED